MELISKIGNEEIATVYVLRSDCGKYLECVESVQPPLPREEKWVLILSTLYGCPVGCKFCDAGGNYGGLVSYNDMMAQIDCLIKSRFADKNVHVKKFKVQFARMGEPSFNKDVLRVLHDIPKKYHLDSYMPSLSTIAPAACVDFFEQAITILHKFNVGSYQMQFSVHSTDLAYRNWLIPIEKLSFDKIAKYGERLHRLGDRKITLNFALSASSPVDVDVLSKFFDPQKFLIKITPVNPTYAAKNNNVISSENYIHEILENAKKAGYDAIFSLGELEENLIGSNCGQYVIRHMQSKTKLENSYTY